MGSVGKCDKPARRSGDGGAARRTARINPGEMNMKVAQGFASKSMDELIAELGGGTLVVYSVARPVDADHPVERSGVLVTFTFAVPAFSAGEGGPRANFTANPVTASAVGTPGFARAFKADGTTVVADFSAGAGNAEVRLSEVSAVADYPISVIGLHIDPPAA
jgi:hypothetical protein